MVRDYSRHIRLTKYLCRYGFQSFICMYGCMPVCMYFDKDSLCSSFWPNTLSPSSSAS